MADAARAGVLKRAKRKAMQAGTFVNITKFEPTVYAMEGILLADMQLGKPVYLAGMNRNGALVDGTFASAPVDGVSPDGFIAGDALYCIERLGESGDFSLLAEVLLRELKAHELKPM
jgi:hypothetical protein